MIDATLLDSMLDVVGPGAAIAHRTGVSDQRIGPRFWFLAPRNVYECSDGWICMSGSADSVAKRILKVVGGDALEHDPRFATNADRIASVDALDALISAWTSMHTWRDAVQILADAGAAAGPVYSAEQLIADGHVIAVAPWPWSITLTATANCCSLRRPRASHAPRVRFATLVSVGVRAPRMC